MDSRTRYFRGGTNSGAASALAPSPVASNVTKPATIHLIPSTRNARTRNKATIAATRLLILGLIGFAPTMRGAGQYVKIDYPASSTSNELQVAVSYTLWIPAGVKTLRGIIVHQHGAGTTASIEGSTAAYDLHWQALSKKWDCALWGSSYHVLNEKIDISAGASELWFDPRRGSEKTFLMALGEFAVQAGHPEIDQVPWR